METRNESAVTLEEAAEYLGTSTTTTRNLAYAGRLEAIYESGSDRISGVTVESVLRADRDNPRDADGKRRWVSTPRIEPYIYAERRRGGQVIYRVRRHGFPSKGFKNLRAAQLYRDSLSPIDDGLIRSNGRRLSLWERLFGRRSTTAANH
jgi:excisionase family DNA binding protein